MIGTSNKIPFPDTYSLNDQLIPRLKDDTALIYKTQSCRIKLEIYYATTIWTQKKGGRHFSENVQGTLRNCRREPQIFTRIIKATCPSLNKCKKGLHGLLLSPISILTAHRPGAWHDIPLHPAWPRVNGQLKSRTKEHLTPDERQACVKYIRLGPRGSSHHRNESLYLFLWT